MVHYKKVIQGIVNYIDDEFVSRFSGSWKAWAIGGMAAIVAARADTAFSALRDNPALKALGLIDGENIDIDVIYAELLRQAQKGTATVEMPVVGAVTFSAEDVESVYRHIVNAKGAA